MKAAGKLIMTTVSNEDLVEQISEVLIGKNLAACIQAFPVKSRFKWEGKVQCEPEILMFIKTSSEAAAEAMKTIKDNHTYDLPEILCCDITDGLPAYISWMINETST